MKSRKLFLAALLAVCGSLSAQQAVPVRPLRPRLGGTRMG